MRDFIDSTDIANNRTALRDRLRADGYLFFRGLVNRDALRRSREGICRVLATRAWLLAGTDPLEARPGLGIPASESNAYMSAYIDIQRLEEFHRLAHDRDLMAVFRTLVDDDAFTHPRKIARLMAPGAPETPPHQDFTHVQGTPDLFTAWMPLSDCPTELGGLRILAGSHTEGLRTLHPSPGAGGVGAEVSADDPRWASTGYQLGDVVIFHSFVLHGGLPNKTSRIRLSCDFRYQSAGDSIVLESLKPHYFGWIPDVPDWPEMTRGWTTSRWCEAPERLQVAKMVTPDGDIEGWTARLYPARSEFMEPR